MEDKLSDNNHNSEIVIGIKISPSVDVMVGFNQNTKDVLSRPRWVRDDFVRRITNLDIFPKVYDRLLSLHPVEEVARWLKDIGYFPNVSLSSLSMYVQHMKATIPKHYFVRHHSASLPSVARINKVVERQIDMLEKLELMAQWSWDRVEKIRKADMAMNLPLPMDGFKKEIDTTLTIFKELKEARKNAGTDDPAKWPSSADTVDMEKVYDEPGINKVVDNPPSRYKLLKIMNKIEQMSNRKDDLPSEEVIESSEEIIQEVDLNNIDQISIEPDEGVDDDDSGED